MIGVWLGEDQVTNSIEAHVQKRWDYPLQILLTNSKHNWEDMCLHLRKQQTR